MAITRTLANGLLYEMGRGSLNFETGIFRAILMKPAFVFDRIEHDRYSKVTDQEIPMGNGYASGGALLLDAGGWQQDNTWAMATISWQDAVWTAQGGSIGPVSGAVVMQFSEDTPGDSRIVGHINFGELVTVTEGVIFQLKNMGFDLRQGG
ncbi:hypothetical protein [Desulfobotulus mexicanus]|uniref:Uncharacterized protein n=1 Tax=Desulfobotulus mexicanus TaxID=2586642 RepID=A0A5S5MBZ6_9BACT|nr:hypothetical protein [Desulfobotulus mexicanus]TYT73258.1 hypothetical protein FIM25_16090 [Desulfobotulus mexicanus]